MIAETDPPGNVVSIDIAMPQPVNTQYYLTLSATVANQILY